jgi:Na+/proline symporter
MATGGTGSVLSFIPDLSSAWMPMITFLMYVSVNWWATWYPGAEPGGGGYVAQRIFSAKNEKHSILATFWFNFAHYALRPWPWIIVALVAMVRFQNDPQFASDPESGYVRIMLLDLPPSLRGLMVAAFAAAYMSTIGTQLNWGASTLVNDLYRRFLRRTKNEKHYVRASQGATILLMATSATASFYMTSIAGAWQFLMALGAGTGLVYLLRWYWWRINAWSEVAAMGGALASSLVLQFGFGLTEADPVDFAWLVLLTTLSTTVIWVAATFLTRPEREEVLIAFYRRVRPASPWWKPIARLAPDIPPSRGGMTDLGLWLLGSAFVYCSLFGVGKMLFGEPLLGGAALAGAAIAMSLIYISLARRGWESVAR